MGTIHPYCTHGDNQGRIQELGAGGGGGGGGTGEGVAGVGQSRRWNRLGEGVGGWHPSRPAGGSGGVLQAPPAGPGAEAQKPTILR